IPMSSVSGRAFVSAGIAAPLSLALGTKASGEPLAGLDLAGPRLGARGNAVVLPHDPADQRRHAHPLFARQPPQGRQVSGGQAEEEAVELSHRHLLPAGPRSTRSARVAPAGRSWDRP